MSRGRTSYGPGRLWRRQQARGAVWVLDWRDEHGRRRRDHVGRSKADAEEVRAELISRRNRRLRGIEVEERELALADLRDRYLADLASRASDRHAINVEIHLRHVLAALPAATVQELKAVHVVEFRNQMLRDGARPRTANAHLQSFKAMLNWAVKVGLLTSHPLRGIERLPDGRKHQAYRRRALTEDEITRFLAAVEEEDARLAERGMRIPQAAMWQALLETGIRYGEMRQLRWVDLDEKRLVLAVRAETAKAGVGRQIPLRGELAARLERLRTIHALALGRPATPGDTLFLTPRGKPWPVPSNNINRCLRRLLEAAGIPRVDDLGEQIDLHALRHSFVSRLARAGVSITHAAALAGHSDVRLTQRVYTHVQTEDLRSAVERIGQSQEARNAS